MLSLLAWWLLAILVNRGDNHIEIRELPLWQIVPTMRAVLRGASAVFIASEYGPWSWLRPVRRLQRGAAMALFALAVVIALYGVSLLFR